MNVMLAIDELDIAVLIPCRDEALTVVQVIRDIKNVLPAATIYVYDNNSIDQTAQLAREAGAVVRREGLQGKGFVVCRMFADIDADIYLLIDGDATYDASSARRLIEHLLANRNDMVSGARTASSNGAYRQGHRFGNWLLTTIVNRLFTLDLRDMLTGYRVFSRRFVKSFPMLASGFEIEAMLTIHAGEMKLSTDELPTKYYNRPGGSVSKLNTFRDGWRILKMIGLLIKELRPLAFFSCIFALLALTSLLLGIPVVFEFMQTGEVARLPTAVLAASIMLLAFLSLFCGIILSSVSLERQENKRLQYLAIPYMTAARGYGVGGSEAK